MTLSLTIKEIFKMAHTTAHFNAGVILVASVADRYIYNSPSPISIPPSPPSLINLVVSVDVNQHVYLLRRTLQVYCGKDRKTGEHRRKDQKTGGHAG